ncbi:hypothetical protein PAXRUDRAFT_147903, partial [Paxillus rubicundulus Ve08.2h10]
RNVVIFGDSGVGKSSVVNLLAPSSGAKTSSGVSTCTFMSQRYDVVIDDENFGIWDTAGLNGGSITRSRIPSRSKTAVDMTTATVTLESLLYRLDREGGIQLLVYVIKGPSVSQSLARNYDIFNSAISRKKVPISVIITGLENVEGDMEDWWEGGEGVLKEFDMYFDAHACVTTLPEGKTQNPVLAERRRHSQVVLRKMLMETCRQGTVQHRDTKFWVRSALGDVYSLINSGPKWDRITNVALCSGEASLVNTALIGEWETCSARIRGRSYTFHNVSNTVSSPGSKALSSGWGRGPDLLVYVPGGPIDDAKSVSRLHTFCELYHGDVCPLVVVAKEDAREAWEKHVRERGLDAKVTFYVPQSEKPMEQVHEAIAMRRLMRGPSRATSKRRKASDKDKENRPSGLVRSKAVSRRSLPGIHSDTVDERINDGQITSK